MVTKAGSAASQLRSWEFNHAIIGSSGSSSAIQHCSAVLSKRKQKDRVEWTFDVSPQPLGPDIGGPWFDVMVAFACSATVWSSEVSVASWRT